jgi:hypothetical protein
MRATLAILGLSLTILLSSCSGECYGLCGSECELIDCSYDRIDCQRYPSDGVNDAAVVHYMKVISEGEEQHTAKIYIDLVDIENAEGHLIEGDNFIERVILSRPGDTVQWHTYSGKDCLISKGGNVPAEPMEGECNFAFTNGYFLTAQFSCIPEAAE